MRFLFAIAVLCVSTLAASTVGQPAEVAPNPPDAATDGAAEVSAEPTPVPAEIALDAYDAVREGNLLLRAGKAKDALRLYEHADRLKPEAREIAFAEGLSRYALGDYDQARDSFQRVSLGQGDALADDALYSEGASYHAEALGAMDNPQLALSQLETAMQRYQSVLKHRPDHEGAKDANYKAAHAWRQIKQMMQEQQQQQQQQQQPSDKQNDEQEQQEQDQQQQDQNDQQQSPEDQQQQQEQQSDQSEQQQSQQQEGDQQQQDEQQQQQAQAEQEESEEQQPQPSQQEQDVSREQAERKLREMMQAQRQRQKNRKKQRALVPVRPTEKDW